MGGHYNCEASFCEEKEHVLCVSMANRVTASRVNKTVNVIMYFLLDSVSYFTRCDGCCISAFFPFTGIKFYFIAYFCRCIL